MATELVARIRAACAGHPHAKIEWPHRVLHEAADRIEALEAERDEAEAAIYGRHERGFVLRPLVDPPSLPEAVRDIKGQRDAETQRADSNFANISTIQRHLDEATIRAEAAEAALSDAVKALEPFAKLGSIILAEAPPEAKTIVVFTSATGEKFAMQLDYFRAAIRSRTTESGQ